MRVLNVAEGRDVQTILLDMSYFVFLFTIYSTSLIVFGQAQVAILFVNIMEEHIADAII